MSRLKYILMVLGILTQVVHGTLYWEKIVDSLSYQLAEKPAPRRDAAIAHDRERNRIIIFGGRQTINNHMQSVLMPVLFDDTWEFNLNTKIWRKLSFSLERPSPRYGALYSHNEHALYLACGRGWLDEYYNDLWMYDFRKDQWKQMDQTHISILPEARYGAFGGMYPAYESASVGTQGNFYLAHGSSQFFMHQTMYAYMFTDAYGLNGIWEKLYTDFLGGPYGFSYPHAREFASSAMVSEDELLVHGGCLSGGFSGGPCPAADSWVFSYRSSKWHKVDATCISPRKNSAMASLVSDGTQHAAIMFSGEESDRTILVTDREKDDEVAFYDSFAKKWLIKKTQGFFYPEKRHGHMMCSGRFNGQFGVFVFGGYGHASDTNLADLWFLQANISTIYQNQMLSTLVATGKCSNHFTTIHLHAILMFVGWAIFMNIKSFWQRYSEVNKKNMRLAIKGGTVLESFGILIITAGLVLGFYSSHGLPSLPHLVIGLIAYICVLLQQVASYLKKTNKNDYILDERDDPTKKYDFFLFNLIHQNSGSIGLILASVNISLGVFYAVLDWYWLVIWFSFLGVCAVLYTFLEIVNFLNYSDDVARETKLNDFDTTSNYSNISLAESIHKIGQQQSSFCDQSHTRYVPSEPTARLPLQQSRPPNGLNSSNNVDGNNSFSKVNNISQSNLQKLNKYQNSRENLVNTINLKYYL